VLKTDVYTWEELDPKPDDYSRLIKLNWPDGVTRFPVFQFIQDPDQLRDFQQINRDYLEKVYNSDPWAITFWWLDTNPWLGEAVPIKVLRRREGYQLLCQATRSLLDNSRCRWSGSRR